MVNELPLYKQALRETLERKNLLEQRNEELEKRLKAINNLVGFTNRIPTKTKNEIFKHCRI